MWNEQSTRPCSAEVDYDFGQQQLSRFLAAHPAFHAVLEWVLALGCVLALIGHEQRRGLSSRWVGPVGLSCSAERLQKALVDVMRVALMNGKRDTQRTLVRQVG